MTPDIEKRFALREVRSLPTGEGSGPKLVGYAAVFNARSQLMGCINADGEDERFYEELAPGCFADTLRRDDIVSLRNHNEDMPLGRTSAGSLLLSEDATGLAFENALPMVSYALDLAVLLEQRAVSGCSFGFLVDGDDGEEIVDGPDGFPLRRLLRVRLVEVSFGVTWPAYLTTSVALRSIRSIRSHVASKRERRDAAPSARPRLQSAKRRMRSLGLSL